MNNKLTFLACSLYLPLVLGSDKPEQSATTGITAQETVKQTHHVTAASKLDVVSPVKPIQEIILGYLCNHSPYTFLDEIESNRDLHSIALSHDGSLVAACRKNMGINAPSDMSVWNVKTGKKISSFSMNEYPLIAGTDLRFRSDSNYVVDRPHMLLYDIQSGEQLVPTFTAIDCFKQEIEKAKRFGPELTTHFSRDETHCLQIATDTDTLKFYEINISDGTKKLLFVMNRRIGQTIFDNPKYVLCYTISDNHHTIAIGSSDNCLDIFDLTTSSVRKIDLYQLLLELYAKKDKKQMTDRNHPKSYVKPLHIVLSQDGKKYAVMLSEGSEKFPADFFVVGNTDGTGAAFFAQYLNGRYDCGRHSIERQSLTFSPDNKYLLYIERIDAMISDDNSVVIYNLATGLDEPLVIPSSKYTHTSFSADGNYLALADEDRTIKILCATKHLLEENKK